MITSDDAFAAGGQQHLQRVEEIDLLRDAVLLLQGINGHYVRFQDAVSGIERDKLGYPVHPLERGRSTASIEGQLVFNHPSSQVCFELDS